MEENELKFYEGQLFSSFTEVEKYFEAYNEAHWTLFSIGRSELCNKDPVLKYKFVTFKCKHFGEKRDNPKATGQRPKQKTYKIGCEAFVHLTRQSKVGKLKVHKLFSHHNHDCTEEVVAGYPENRRLSDISRANVLEYAKLKAKPTLVKPLLRQIEGQKKIILSRDISNIRTKDKIMLRNGRSDEQMLIDKLAEVHANDPKAFSHIEYDPVSKEVIFLILQTSEMREMLHQFPEVILMDITYKINKNRMPVSVTEVMDEEGLGQVVAYIFLANELKETLTAALMCFAEASGKEIFEKTNCVVVDKDFSEIGAVKAVMPNAKVHLCSVHVERNLKGAATGEKKRKQAIDAFRGMVYSETEEEFQSHLLEFKEAASDKLFLYFDKNWLKCREAWSLKDRILVKTLRNHTTNRVESHNQKLKMIFSVDTELYEAIDGIVNILMHKRRDDLRYRAHESLTKRTCILKCSNPLVPIICNDLSDYAAKLVNEQLSLSDDPSPFPDKYQVSEDSCSCSLYKTMELPCRHIMRLRKQKGLPEYDKNIVPKRWWLKSRKSSKSTVEGANSTIIKARMPAQRVACVMNSRDRFLEVAPITQKISSLLTDLGTKKFHRRRQVLSDIVHAWSNGEEVALVHLSHNNQEVTADERTQEHSSSLDTPFQLNVIKVAGKPRGIGETVHDGSKKIARKKTNLVVSIDDDHTPDDPNERCEPIVAKEPDDHTRGEPHEPGKGKKPDCFKLKTVTTRGRPATTVTRKKKWSYRVFANKKDSSKCCICKEDIAGYDFCHKCQNAVHADIPCSVEDERGIRLCNFCCDYSVGSQDLEEAFLCLGCSRLLERTIWTQSGSRQGCFYYRCREGKTPNCKNRFAFWASKIARKTYSVSDGLPLPNSEELNEEQHDSENVQESPSQNISETNDSDNDHENERPTKNIRADMSDTDGSDNDCEGPTQNIRADMSDTDGSDNDYEGPTQNMGADMSDTNGSDDDHESPTQNIGADMSGTDGSDNDHESPTQNITEEPSQTDQTGIVNLEEWRKQCETCNKFGENAFNYLDFCETCGAPVHTGNKSCSVAFGTSDDDKWVCLKCNTTTETRRNAHSQVHDSLNKSSTSDNIEIIVIDSGSDCETTDAVEWPIKEEFNRSNELNDELNQVLDGLVQENLPGPGTCEKAAERKNNNNWKCFTCGNRDVELRSIKTPGVNFGRKYYGCYSVTCTRPKPFLFWARKEDDPSKTLVPSAEERVNVTMRRKRGAPLRSNSDPVPIGEVTATQGDQGKRPKRKIQLPVFLRKSYTFETS